jgi:MFS family permease
VPVMEQKRNAMLILRAAVGGVVGAVLYLIGEVILQKLTKGFVPWSGALHVMALGFLVPIGFVMGSFIGFIIWAITTKAKVQLSGLIRATIGGVFMVFLSTPIYLIWGSENTGLNRPSLLEQFVSSTMSFAFLGALPGLVARLPGQHVQQVPEFRLVNLRKLELAFGCFTLVAALLSSVLAVKLNADVSPRIEKEFPLGQELATVLLFFLIPGALVCSGSYAHAKKGWSWGPLVVGAGLVAVLASSLFFFIYLPFDKITVWSSLNISFVVLAVMTLVFSFKVERALAD